MEFMTSESCNVSDNGIGNVNKQAQTPKQTKYLLTFKFTNVSNVSIVSIVLSVEL